MTAALEGGEWSVARPRRTLPILQEAGWAPGPVWTAGNSRTYRDSIADRPARSQSQYRLSYPAHSLSRNFLKCLVGMQPLVAETDLPFRSRSVIVSGYVIDTNKYLQCVLWNELKISFKIRDLLTLRATLSYRLRNPFLRQRNTLLQWVFFFAPECW